ncbi:MAG TPA: DNA polymerase III subunit delta [Candidatus Paceibacterota bacterium]|nr:DNA polymerase III subunit delta [Candidatus Paceibacterota bacterium]
MITLLYGTDAWRLDHAAREFRARWSASGGTPPVILDGASPDTSDELERMLKYPTFFGAAVLATVNDPLTIPGLMKMLTANDAHRIQDVHILLIQRTSAKESAERNKALAGLARIAAKTTEFAPLTGARCAGWVREYCAQTGREITPEAVAELIRRAGTETWALVNELEKLCAYEPERVTIATVQLLVPRPHQMDEWELSDAIGTRDKRGAITALHRRVANGTPEPLLIGSLASSVRSLLMVRELADRGIPPAAIAKSSGLHPFVVAKTLRGARAYDPRALRNAHSHLALLDRASKEGRADAVDGLFGILLAL